MRWNNCSKEEARDAYDSAKSRLQNAADQYIHNKYTMDTLAGERSSAQTKLNNANGQKVNFEKRIADIERIIQKLGSNGPVEEAINTSNDRAQKFEDSYNDLIQCTGMNTPQIAKAFHTPSVEENAYSAAAVAECKKVKANLEQAVADLNNQLNAMEDEVNRLTSQMNSLAGVQADLSKTMASSSYEMNHFKNRM